ncbi:MAG: hypothetical protein AB8B56_01765, partial [Crocinitomicaceae bacterium]
MLLLLPKRMSIVLFRNSASFSVPIFLLALSMSLSFEVTAQCADITYTGDCDGDGVINGLDLDDEVVEKACEEIDGVVVAA